MAKKKITKKSKAQEAKKVADKKEELDPLRMDNVPTKVTLSIGEFEVRELDFWSFTQMVASKIGSYWNIFSDLDLENLNAEDIAVLLIRLTATEDFREEFSTVFAKYCGDPDNEDFKNITFADFEILAPAILEKVDFEAIKRFFTQTLPKLVEGAKNTQIIMEPKNQDQLKE